MKTGWVAATLGMLLATGTPAVGDPLHRDTVPSTPPDSIAARALLLTGAAAPLPRSSLDLTLTAPSPRPRAIPGLLHPHRIQLNRAETSLQGLGLVANHVGFLAALGSATGLIDEKTAWKMIAAGAAAGALWGATLGSENATLNTRVVLAPDRPFEKP